MFYLEDQENNLKYSLEKDGAPGPLPSKKKKKKEKKRKKHAVTNSIHSRSNPTPSPIHPTSKTYFLHFLTARQRSNENLSTPGFTQRNLELTLASLNKQKHVDLACLK